MKNENNTPIAEEVIHNNPTGYGLFAGIGDNFNSAAQAICELADDAISNLRANSNDPDLSMTVVLSFEDLGDAVEIGVVDGGTGITNTTDVKWDSVTMSYLRDTLGFDGIVVTDWWALGMGQQVSGVTNEGVELSEQTGRWLYNEALKNGTDMFGAGGIKHGEEISERTMWNWNKKTVVD